MPVLRSTTTVAAPVRTVAGVLRDLDAAAAVARSHGYAVSGPARLLSVGDEVRVVGSALRVRVTAADPGRLAWVRDDLTHAVAVTPTGTGSRLAHELRWTSAVDPVAVRRMLDAWSVEVQRRAVALLVAPVVVATALVRDGTVLVAQRTRPPALAGRWELPGGRVERGESEPAAVARECREELGTAAGIAHPLIDDSVPRAVSHAPPGSRTPINGCGPRPGRAWSRHDRRSGTAGRAGARCRFPHVDHGQLPAVLVKNSGAEGTGGAPDPSKWGMSIDSLLARQAGVISRSQALAEGLTRDAVDHRVRLRRWRPLHPQVYLAAGHRRDDEVAVRGAVLWGGDRAVLTGEAAAWWHGLVDRPPPRIRLTVPRRRNPRERTGVEVRRRDLAECDITVHRGLLITDRPLTVLDAAVDLGGAGGRFLDRALQRSERFPAVYAAYCRNLGAEGSASAGQLLVAAADRSASVAERLLVRMLCEAGARGWHCGFPAGGYLIDIAFPDVRVAIEVDGWAWHMDAERTQADKWRQNALVRAGWTILRYTWHDLVERPKVVLAEIAHAITRVRAAG